MRSLDADRAPVPAHGGSLEPHEVGYPQSLELDIGASGSILRRLRRRRMTFALVFLLVGGLVGGVYFMLPSLYRAEASVTIAPPDAVLSSQRVSGAQQLIIGDAADLESQSVALASPTLLRQFLEQPDVATALLQECAIGQPPAWKTAIKGWLGFKPMPSCTQQVANSSGEVGNLLGKLSVFTNGRSRVITVAFTSPSAEVAQLLANRLVSVYLQQRATEKLQPRDAAIEWLQTEVSRVSDRLKKTELAIETYLHDHGLIRGQSAPIASERLSSLAQQLASAEADQAAAAGRMKQANGKTGGSTRDVLDSRQVSDVKQQLAVVTGQIALLSTRYGPDYPALSELRSQQAGLQGLVGQETGRVVRSAQNDYQAATSRVTELQQQVNALKLEVRGNDDATTQIATLQRDAEVDRELYVDLTKKLNELQTDRRLVMADARLVSLAELPEQVFFPKVMTFVLAGGLLATALATLAALLRDRGDPTVRTSSNLETAANLPVLAHVPHVRLIGGGVSGMMTQVDHPSMFQEAIRGLYAECMLVGDHDVGLRKRPRSLMVTSSGPGEGKSFVALALAHFVASTGQRVLLIEGDLRRPSIGATLSLEPKMVLTTYLRGRGEPKDLVCPSRTDGLDVMLAGRPALSSTELLAGRRMPELLAWAVRNYDFVVVDTPPSLALRDARIIARHTDGVLYCAQWGHSHTAAVLGGVRNIQTSGGRVLGLVLDRVKENRYRLYNAQRMDAAGYLGAYRS